jgi:hypothetical protein
MNRRESQVASGVTWLVVAVALGSSLVGCGPQPQETPQTPPIDRPLVGYPEQNPALMDGADTVWTKHKVGENEYFAQPNDWTCSASCCIMVHRVLTGEDIGLDEMVQRTGAVPGRGAENAQVVEAMKKLGSNLEVKSGVSSSQPQGTELSDEERAAEKAQELETLKQLLRDGYVVIVNFREPVDNGGHYGVLQGINDQAIEIADPYYGLQSVLAWKDFDFRTGYSDPVLHGWYLAVRKP